MLEARSFSRVLFSSYCAQKKHSHVFTKNTAVSYNVLVASPKGCFFFKSVCLFVCWMSDKQI